MMKKSLIIILLFYSVVLLAQKEWTSVLNGNILYEKEKYDEAEADYRKGLEQNNSSFAANFNLGNALFKQEKYEEAAEQFSVASALADGDKERIAAAFHNRGNSLLKANKIYQ